MRGPTIPMTKRKLDPQKYATVKAEFEKIEAVGIVRQSNSPWSSALHIVRKPVEIFASQFSARKRSSF